MQLPEGAVLDPLKRVDFRMKILASRKRRKKWVPG